MMSASDIAGVSCTSASACTAVWNYDDGSRVGVIGHSIPLAEAWNGTSWSIQPTANPASVDNVFRSVSCTSASACTAVGASINWAVNSAGTHAMLVEAWDGTSWSIQPIPSPTGSAGADLSGVSCTSPNACTAVGDAVNSAGRVITLVERYS